MLGRQLSTRVSSSAQDSNRLLVLALCRPLERSRTRQDDQVEVRSATASCCPDEEWMPEGLLSPISRPTNLNAQWPVRLPGDTPSSVTFRSIQLIDVPLMSTPQSLPWRRMWRQIVMTAVSSHLLRHGWCLFQALCHSNGFLTRLYQLRPLATKSAITKHL